MGLTGLKQCPDWDVTARLLDDIVYWILGFTVSLSGLMLALMTNANGLAVSTRTFGLGVIYRYWLLVWSEYP